MLARLLQVLVLTALAVAALLFAAAWWAGYPGWGLVAALLVLGLHAPLQALEFMILHRIHGEDPTPRPSLTALLSAWVGEVLAAPRVFYWTQPFRAGRFADHLPSGARGRRGVLLVHGFVCNRGVWNDWLYRLRAQGVPVVAVNLEPVFGPVEAYAPIVEAGMRRLEACTGLPPVVVAHSMGGLTLRHWWADHDGDARVHHAITMGSPHHGTWIARWAFTANSRQMQLGSRWLTELAASEPPHRSARFTCFHSNCDNIVMPPATATLAGANNRLIEGVAHVQMVDRPEPWQALQSLLAAAPQPLAAAPVQLEPGTPPR